MYRNILATSLVAASLFFSGCGDDSANCRFDVQSDLDTGNFDAAISQLEGACKDEYTASDRYFNLASAYMGKAGYGAIDVVNMVLDAGDSDNAFSSLTRSVSENGNERSLDYLNQAKIYYLQATQPDKNASSVSMDICDENSTDTRITNACYYIGFAQTFQATTTITALTNDVDQLVTSIDNDSGDTPIDMKASLDALAWATASTLPNGSTITAQSVTILGTQYQHLNIIQNGETFYRLADAAAPSSSSSTVVTQGYCNSDGNKTVCDGIENSDGSIDINFVNAAQCYACPLTVDNGTNSVAELLVDSLNNGTSVLSSISTSEDVQKSIDEFVQDITNDPNAKAGDVNVTIQDVLDYLNK